jgi:hypothetical protein
MTPLRWAVLRFLFVFALAAVGAVIGAATGGTTSIVGWGIVTLAVSLVISLVFLEVGYSEDRARARQEAPDNGSREQQF